jgi:drug/metabolite transporter (DMT)-like permease
MLLADITNLSDFVDYIPFDGKQLVGIPFALVGAVFLSLGAQFQHAGVGRVESDADAANLAKGRKAIKTRLQMSHLISLLKRPSWLIGTLLLVLAIVFQLISLAFSPLIVVQPIGAVALVITAILNSRVSRVKLNSMSILSIVLCVVGIGLFVSIAAYTARDRPLADFELWLIVGIMTAILLALGSLFFFGKGQTKAIWYIIGAGVLYGFVATLAKVVMQGIVTQNMSILTWVCLLLLIVGTALGSLFVQNAYSSGPPDLVIAGLTVIDPIVAVTIAIVILQEAAQAGPVEILAFIGAGIISVIGVFLLARHHPQTHQAVDDVSQSPESSQKRP